MKSLKTKKSQNPILLAIHGFTGETYDFAPLYESANMSVDWRFVDLPGHHRLGSTSLDSTEEWQLFVTRIDEVVRESIEEGSDLYVLAYSMGSRLFLRAMLEQSWSFTRVFLVGATGGILEEQERISRLTHDLELAGKLQNEGISSFIDDWMNQPIIRTQQSALESKRVESKKQLDPIALARSLVNYSNGKLIPIWDQLSSIESEIVLISGEWDQKFSSIHSQMASLFQHAACEQIKDSGHAPHLEAPKEFTKLLLRYL